MKKYQTPQTSVHIEYSTFKKWMFSYIYSSNENKLALDSIDNNVLACGEKMTKTTMNYYLLDYKDNNQIQKYFQESNKDIEYGEDKVFEETKHNINNQLKKDCKIIKTFDNFGLWFLLIFLIVLLSI